MKETLFVCTMVSLLGCSSDPAPGLDLPAVPSSATLCTLTPNVSTAADVRGVLGAPSTSQTFSDGSSTLMFSYKVEPMPNLTVAIIQFWFTASQVFSTATVSNAEMPSCWQFDGGL